MNGQCSDDTYFDFTFMVMYIYINSVRGRRGLDRIGSWISNYLCYHCLSPPLLWVWTPLKRGVLVTTLYDKVCQWLATGRWFSRSGRGEQHYVIKFVSDLRQVGGFLQHYVIKFVSDLRQVGGFLRYSKFFHK